MHCVFEPQIKQFIIDSGLDPREDYPTSIRTVEQMEQLIKYGYSYLEQQYKLEESFGNYNNY